MRRPPADSLAVPIRRRARRQDHCGARVALTVRRVYSRDAPLSVQRLASSIVRQNILFNTVTYKARMLSFCDMLSARCRRRC